MKDEEFYYLSVACYSSVMQSKVCIGANRLFRSKHISGFCSTKRLNSTKYKMAVVLSSNPDKKTLERELKIAVFSITILVEQNRNVTRHHIDIVEVPLTSSVRNAAVYIQEDFSTLHHTHYSIKRSKRSSKIVSGNVNTHISYLTRLH